MNNDKTKTVQEQIPQGSVSSSMNLFRENLRVENIQESISDVKELLELFVFLQRSLGININNLCDTMIAFVKINNQFAEMFKVKNSFLRNNSQINNLLNSLFYKISVRPSLFIEAVNGCRMLMNSPVSVQQLLTLMDKVSNPANPDYKAGTAFLEILGQKKSVIEKIKFFVYSPKSYLFDFYKRNVTPMLSNPNIMSFLLSCNKFFRG